MSHDANKFAVVHGRRIGGWVLHVPRSCRALELQWFSAWPQAIASMDRLLDQYRRRQRGERAVVPAQQERLYQ